MAKIAGVQFQKEGKIYDFDTNQLDVRPGDYVVVNSQHGVELGQVSTETVQTDDESLLTANRKMIRIATEQDLQRSSENRIKEKESYDICQKKIAEHQLDMKLVSVEYAFDNSKAIFYFTANGRVDFRSLVKDLASVFKMRIELRQIGVRDEARMLGGLGPCGRQICCRAFLDEFQPVSIKMAKEQNLSLNPTKISGVCGRLMCCLKYEQDHYEQTRKIMPRTGKEVITPDGKGTVTDLNIVKETVFVRISNGDSAEIKEYQLDRIERITPMQITQQIFEPSEGISEKAKNNNTDRNESEKSELTDNNESGKNQKPAKSKGNGPKKEKDEKKSEKNDNVKKDTRMLGKPVMRENPNRMPKQPNKTIEGKEVAGTPAKKTTWVEAVQKAMDSIN